MLRRRCAFTMVELLMVFVVLAVLVAVLLPVLQSARERPRTTTCLSNLRQLYAGFTMYAADHDDLLPPYQNVLHMRYGTSESGPTVPIPENGALLVRALHPYLKTDALWFCPNDPFARTDASDNQHAIKHRYSSYRTAGGMGMETVSGSVTTTDGPQFLHNRAGAASILLLTDNLWENPCDNCRKPDYSHRGQFNYLFFDGHVKSLPHDENSPM